MALSGRPAAGTLFDHILNSVQSELRNESLDQGQLYSKSEIHDRKEKVLMMRQVEHVLSLNEVYQERGPELKAQLMECKQRVEVEERRFGINMARLKEEIASLSLENQPADEVEMDLSLEMEEALSFELQDVEKSCSWLESQIGSKKAEGDESSLKELEKQIKELEEDIAQLKTVEMPGSKHGAEKQTSVASMLTKLRTDAGWNCGIVLKEVGQERLSIDLTTPMEKSSTRHTHNLTVNLNFSHQGNPLEATITEAALSPAHLSQDELQKKIEIAAQAGDGIDQLKCFVQLVSRCLFWKLPRLIALDEVRTRYSFRTLNTECSLFRCALPSGIEAEVNIPLEWPNDRSTCLTLVNAHAPVLSINLEAAVKKFRTMEIEPNIPLADFLVRLDAWLNDHIINGPN